MRFSVVVTLASLGRSDVIVDIHRRAQEMLPFYRIITKEQPACVDTQAADATWHSGLGQLRDRVEDIVQIQLSSAAAMAKHGASAVPRLSLPTRPGSAPSYSRVADERREGPGPTLPSSGTT